MNHLKKLIPFVKPYWKSSLSALILLTLVVLMDLAIPGGGQNNPDNGWNFNPERIVSNRQ
jgi:hypothetical protein